MSVKKMSFRAVQTACASWAGLAALAWTLPARAAETAAQPTSPPMPAPEFSWVGYVQAIAAMVLVLLVLWGVVWLLRRSGRFPGMPRATLPKGSLFVEGQLNIAPRKGLVVVRFLNKRLLLGVTEQQICMLTELELHEDKPSFDSCLAEAAGKESARTDAD